MDAVAASDNKREAAAMLGVTATHIGSVVHASGMQDLADIWARLPADGVYSGMSSKTPKAVAGQRSADSLIARAVKVAPIDASVTQRESVLLMLLEAIRLYGRHDLPRGWVLSIIRAFEAAGHPCPPTPASLRWYRVRLQQDPNTFSDVAAFAKALAAMPRGIRKRLWKKDDTDMEAHSASDLDDIQALVREACGDSPLDRKRAEGDNAVLLMLALYNITGSLNWPGDWLSAVSDAFVRAGASLPSRQSLSWYRNQLRDDPIRFENVRGVDRQLIEDLLTV